MSNLTNKLWFRVTAFLVMEAFLFTLADISWAADYRQKQGYQETALNAQKAEDEQSRLSTDALSNQLILNQPAAPFMGGGTYQQSLDKAQPASIVDTTISGLSLAGKDLNMIFGTLNKSGFSASEVSFAAMRQGHSGKEIYQALIGAGYDGKEVKDLLGNLLKYEKEKEKKEKEAKNLPVKETAAKKEKQREVKESDKTEFERKTALEEKDGEKAFIEPEETAAPQGAESAKSLRLDALRMQTLEFVRLMILEGKRGRDLISILKKAGIADERIITALSQLGFNLQDIIKIFREADIDCAQIVQALKKCNIASSDKEIYSALLKNGFSDKDIIAALKAVGISADDILKIATELGRNMIEVAQAMLETGFSYAQVANAYLLKAMKWAWDETINIVNCAAHAFDAFLTNVGRKFSSKQDLAYELVIADILETGEVEIAGKDVMTSMLAVKKVAQQYGIDMEGYKLGIKSLLELNEAAIVLLDGNHWVSIVTIDAEQVTIIDNGQKKVISLTEFQTRWDGSTLTVKQYKATYEQLLDLQMRQIRGGRGLFSAIGGFFKSVFKAVGDFFSSVWSAVKSFVASTFFQYVMMVVGIVACILCPVWAPLIMACLSALRTYAITGSFSASLKAFVISYATTYIGQAAGAYLGGATGTVGSQAVNTASTSFWSTVATKITTDVVVTQVVNAAIGQLVYLGVSYVAKELGLDKTAWGRVLISAVSAVAAAYVSYQVNNSDFMKGLRADNAQGLKEGHEDFTVDNGTDLQPGYEPFTMRASSPPANYYNSGLAFTGAAGGIGASTASSFSWNAAFTAAAVAAVKQSVYEICVANDIDT
ncbi:MAG: hypothetical protein KKA52_00415, partial [Candidatus Omnitrophica bacterium]|nr:hypothetical protein [Candidatus Omnitrophota bacterium]